MDCFGVRTNIAHSVGGVNKQSSEVVVVSVEADRQRFCFAHHICQWMRFHNILNLVTV